MKLRILLFLVGVMGIFACDNKPAVQFPNRHGSQNKLVTYEQMTTTLQSVATRDHITLKSMGQSVEGRNLWLLNIKSEAPDPVKVFLYAQQHGNEPAGKEALIWLAKYLAEAPNLKSSNVDLYLMPMVNPDGAENNHRRNSHDVDLNRDHLLLEEPETQLLYKAFYKIKPHITVDCHEFNRTSQSYEKLGYEEWPQIMMGCGNNPLVTDEIYILGVKTIQRLAQPMKNAGHNFCRYFVGGMPPNDENRYSTLEGDDGRNGMALLGPLSFIIESGVKRKSRNPNADLSQRVDAYLTIFDYMINTDSFLDTAKNLVTAANPLPRFYPVNYFWGKTESDIDTILVYEKGKETAIETANFMQRRVVKKSVTVPTQYIIPAEKTSAFQPLLKRHGITYRILTQSKTRTVESVKLLRIEDQFDTVYNRYSGRQITQRVAKKEKTFVPGSWVIDLQKNRYPRKVFYVLEPCNLYGVYQFEKFRKLIDDEILPVYRVVE